VEETVYNLCKIFTAISLGTYLIINVAQCGVIT